MELSIDEKRAHLSDALMSTDVEAALWHLVDTGLADEIVPEAVRAFANAEGLDYEKTLSAVKFNLSNNKKAQMKKHIRKFDPDREMAMTHEMDYDPFDYDEDSEF